MGPASSCYDRAMQLRLVLSLTALSLFVAVPVARAHLRLLDPLPRHPDALKLGPCGQANDARGDIIATYEPGETITVRWEEYVNHPGWYRVSFDDDGFDDFVDPETPTDFDNESVS